MKKSIQLGDKVELVTEVTLDRQQDKYYSQVQEIIDDQHIIIQAPIVNGHIEPLELGRKYGMCIYTDQGLYRCEIVVADREKKERLYLITLEILTTLEKYQRRQYFRMDCILTFQYKDDEDAEWHEGTILDISGGGIRFSSTHKLIEKKDIVSRITLEMVDRNYELYLSGVVIESECGDVDKSIVENRIEFDDIDHKEREVIIKFIFEEERKRRRERKGH